jgi:hypothetical protein
MRVLQLDASYNPVRIIDIGAQVVGIVWRGGELYLSTWHGARTGGCKLMRWTAHGGLEVIASLSYAGISLTHDGTSFWTNDFKADQIVAFTLT